MKDAYSDFCIETRLSQRAITVHLFQPVSTLDNIHPEPVSTATGKFGNRHKGYASGPSEIHKAHESFAQSIAQMLPTEIAHRIFRNHCVDYL